jgi:hypothetical protein
MPTFRVLGEKPMMYWTEVQAKDSYEAYDIADKLTTDKWNLLTKGITMTISDDMFTDKESLELLPPHLQRMVDAGVTGLDIMHGELKNLMLIAEQELADAIEREEETEEAMDSMDRTNAEGRLDMLVELYQLTYQLSFAIGARE